MPAHSLPTSVFAIGITHEAIFVPYSVTVQKQSAVAIARHSNKIYSFPEITFEKFGSVPGLYPISQDCTGH